MDYRKYLNFEELIKGLSRILKINSEGGNAVRTKDGELYPFGQGVQDCFSEVLKLGQELGFEVYNCDNYGGHIDFVGTGEDGKAPRIFAIIGHLDVVPAVGEWEHDPYGAEIADDCIFGRGTLDDKGPIIACLYAMKALKDAGYQPKETIRIILGLDEETDWVGIKYYFDHVERPDYGITPDAEFPVLNGEKGILVFDFAKKFAKNTAKGLELRTLAGGTVHNQVAETARAVLRNTSEKESGYTKVCEIIEDFRKETGYKVNYKGVGKSLEIVATGVPAHGAKPELGTNAISIMMALLGKLNFANESAGDFIDFYNKYIGFDIAGERLGIDFSDEKSGRLSLNAGVIDLTSESAKLTIDVRYPVTYCAEQIFEPLSPITEKYEIGILKESEQKPIFMDADSPMINTLLDIYKEYSGDRDAKPLVIGGGTYARSTPNIVAFGAMFPNDEDLMHQRNERISLNRLRMLSEIYAEAIYKLTTE